METNEFSKNIWKMLLLRRKKVNGSNLTTNVWLSTSDRDKMCSVEFHFLF